MENSARQPATEAGQRLAVIDIGSNSIRLVVAQLLSGGEFRILDEERESTRLARTLGSTHRLDEASITDSLAVLRRFRKISEGFQVHRLRTIATCAVREAENGPDFCRRALEESGVEVEVISSEEEAQLAFLSVQRAFDISDKNVAIADIGGGSTEIVLASENHIEAIYSTPLGAVRMTELCGSQRLFGEDFDSLVREIDRQLKHHLKKLPFVPQVVFGSGGTFTSLASMLIAAKGQTEQPEWGYRTSRAEVLHQLDKLQKMSLKQRRNVPGLAADRADIIVAGLVIIDRLMHRLQVNVLQVHNRGVRDGVLLTMIDELRPQETDAQSRDRAVERFALSCGVDLAHSRQVARLAGEIFAQLCEPFHLDPRDRTLLETAAMLQDVGYLINYERHHKHSYHLILNSRLPGFRRRELELIANVARYHRGARPKDKHENYRLLPPEDKLRIQQLVAILRIAGGLDRSHSQLVQSVDVNVQNGHARMHVTSREDPEVDLWAARRRSDLFEKVFQAGVSIHAN